MVDGAEPAPARSVTASEIISIALFGPFFHLGLSVGVTGNAKLRGWHDSVSLQFLNRSSGRVVHRELPKLPAVATTDVLGDAGLRTDPRKEFRELTNESGWIAQK